MNPLLQRPRRLRASATRRRLVRETLLAVGRLVLPIFVKDDEGAPEEVPSMPGVFRYAVGDAIAAARAAWEAGLSAVLLFGVTARKDECGSAASDSEGCVPRAVAGIRRAAPELTVITDVCLCGYTSHGHCGIVRDGRIVNDATVERLVEMALCHARAGADIVAPSDMMDLRVLRVREALDREGLVETAIMSYAAKYASAYYGPFREAAGSAPAFGDRRTHQMDPANAREAVRELLLDVEEGADLVMVKPALAYLDVVRRAREAVPVPVAAYNVSGEYSMVKAAAARGWIDERAVVEETMIGMFRAGADIIITYHALDLARWAGQA